MSLRASTAAPRIGLGPPLSIPWTTQVSVSSVRSPITTISLVIAGASGTGSYISLYTCPAASASGCLVELNGPELQNLLGTSPVTVPLGTYDRINVDACTASDLSGRRVFMTGSAVIHGTTYYTKTIGALGTAGPAEPVAIDYTGCTVSYPISPPLLITDTLTATTDVRLYFDIFEIATAVLPSPQASNIFVGGPCTPRPTESTPFVCLAYPDPVPVVGIVPPVTERYHVNDGVTIGLVFDASTDLFYGGYNRRLLIEDQLWDPGVAPDPPIHFFTRNGDGTYRLELVGGTATAPGPVFPAWQRASHSGTIVFSDGSSHSYSAVRLP